MDLSPFTAIDPCGYPGLRVTQARDLGVTVTPDQLAQSIMANLDA
jgi:lipoyl(octanoyl) transferase